MEKQNTAFKNSEDRWVGELRREARHLSLPRATSLLERRRIPRILFYAGISLQTASAAYRKLVALQDTIYKLDIYGEQNWRIDSSTLSHYWEQIFEKLSILGLSNVDRLQFCSEMFSYQEIELARRNGIEPTDVEIGHFYRLKTCDVRMARRLLHVVDVPQSPESLQFWEIFDLIAEVNDDLEDQAEDRHTFNANRFLISHSNRTIEEVHSEYCGFVARLLSGLGLPAREDARAITRDIWNEAAKTFTWTGFNDTLRRRTPDSSAGVST